MGWFSKRPQPVALPVVPIAKPEGIVEATGVAMASKRSLGPALEAAMAAEIAAISAESTAIWHGTKPERQKVQEIADLNAPENVRRRMLEAKAKAKAAARGE